MPIRCVYLDAAGTVLRPWPSVGAVYEKACRPYGLQADADQIEASFRKVWGARQAAGDDGMTQAGDDPTATRNWWRGFINEILDDLHFEGDLEGCFEACFRRFEQPDAWQVFDDVHSAVTALREAGLQVGLLSNWDNRLPRLLQRLGIAELFEPKLVSALEGSAKPDPRLFARAASRAGFPPAEILHVGDHPHLDFGAARQAGFQALLLDRHGKSGDRVITGLTAILPWIQSRDVRHAPASGRPVTAASPPAAGSAPARERPEAAEGLLSLPGIGPARAAALSEAGIDSLEDLLTLAPRRYEDRSRFLSLADLDVLPEGSKGVVLVEVTACRLIRTRRRGFSMTRATVQDDSGCQDVIWFNQPYISRHLQPGRKVILYGAVRDARRGTGRYIENPEVELIPRESSAGEAVHMGRMVPVYPRTAGLSSRQLRRILHVALQTERQPAMEFLPPDWVRERGLPDRRHALRQLHFPEPGTDPAQLASWSTPAQQRLAWEEFLVLFTALEMKKQQRRGAVRGWSCRLTTQDEACIRKVLPFPLTPGQEAAWKAIASDMGDPAPMARLLQGDVGCGKTAVAVMAMLLAVLNGRQAVLMAPTEILARQHEARLRRLLQGMDVPLDLLVGGTRQAERSRLQEEWASGRPGLVVGTHALIQRGVRFGALGLAVVDEQHRFGVAQRLQLVAKGTQTDLLVMTATPIPRSLALTRYGDLDLIEIRDRPPGRTPVSTETLVRGRAREAWAAVRDCVARGEQAYVVYPLVEESESRDVAAATEACEALRKGPLAAISVGLVHGRLKAEEKRRTMQAFADGTIKVLVATTVIEVGVDVPAATLLVVAHAERFGLAQLHQLRGRVGRGEAASRCILLHEPAMNEVAARRLGILQDTDDGFLLAQEDLRLRGPGELLGLRQHGEMGLRLADLVRDEALLQQARAEVRRLADEGFPPPLKQAALRRWGRPLDLTRGECRSGTGSGHDEPQDEIGQDAREGDTED